MYLNISWYALTSKIGMHQILGQAGYTPAQNPKFFEFWFQPELMKNQWLRPQHGHFQRDKVAPVPI